MKDFIVLLEDDWELKGNGLGNVASHQYLPAQFLMRTCEELEIPMSFMVETAQGIAYRDTEGLSRDHQLQHRFWEETVHSMVDRGFDVQLHLHPQWWNAVYKDGFFHLGEDWNIGNYDPSAQKELIQKGVRYLKEAFGVKGPIAFKGGSWGLQPSHHLLDTLKEEGIRLLLGMRDGLWIPDNNVDYRGMEEPYLPYYPDKADIRKKGENEGIIALPLQPYAPGIKVNLRLAVRAIRRKLMPDKGGEEWGTASAPAEILANSPLKERSKFRSSFHPYLAHLKIGEVPFAFMREGFERILRRSEKFEERPFPIVIESHTKSFHGYYRDISRFLEHVRKRYSDRVTFMDLTTYYETYARPWTDPKDSA